MTRNREQCMRTNPIHDTGLTGEAFLFTVDGMSDSGDVTEPESWRSCGGLQVFLNKAPIAHKSKMQSSASLSMAEGELIASCDAAQMMLFVMHVLEDMGLRVKNDSTRGLQRGYRPNLRMECEWINETCIN